MVPSLIRVTAHDNHTLSLLFDNGESGMLDLKPFLDLGVFQKIKNLDEFRRVRIVFDTVEWECGVDLDPEYIYKNCRNLPISSQSH